MTPTDIVHERRLAAVTHAIEIGNVSEAARRFGVSRKTLHGWKNSFEAYGPEGLRPKQRRRPVPPNTAPDHRWRCTEGSALAATAGAQNDA